MLIKQKNRIIKYKEFDKQTSIIAGNLKLFGLDRQDKVCILLPNLPEAILSFWGIERAGLVTVLSNPAYNEQILLQQILDSDSKVIITTDVNANKVINLIDEPTAALNEDDSENLLNLLLEFKNQGMTSIIISHKLNEIAKVADSITILRDGKTIETLEMKNGVTEDRIIKGINIIDWLLKNIQKRIIRNARTY